MSESNQTPVTLGDSNRLMKLEETIKNGLQTFFDVGNALAEIMEGRLYQLKGFGSFAEYCETVWGFKKSYAYQLIRSAEVLTELPAPVSTIVENFNPGQVRELAKVPKEQRKTVVTTAVMKAKSAGRKMTAKDISEASRQESEPVLIVAKTDSIEIQLRELWNKASITERDRFLAWVKIQTVQQPQGRLQCNCCDQDFEDDEDAVALYECADCGSTFTKETSASENHQCPDCNKFGRKLSDRGCPECNEGELEEIPKTAERAITAT